MSILLRLCLTTLLLLVALPDARAAERLGDFTDGQVLQGRFVQLRQLSGFPAPLKSEGRFILVAGRGLIWQAETPFAVTTVISPAGLVQEAGGVETMRLPAARLPFIARLYAMLGGALSGDWQGLEEAFTVAREGSDTAWNLRLLPRKAGDAAIPFREILIQGGQFADRVEIVKPDGDRDILTFLDQRLSGQPLSAEDMQLLDMAGRR
ncbi:LolA-related protein [Ferrovibrio terrae]|uniref:LolA family protein n=1 Tax=Ferrovibrio terrae TaxID=2594003 RepID=UPI00313840D0